MVVIIVFGGLAAMAIVLGFIAWCVYLEDFS